MTQGSGKFFYGKVDSRILLVLSTRVYTSLLLLLFFARRCSCRQCSLTTPSGRRGYGEWPDDSCSLSGGADEGSLVTTSLGCWTWRRAWLLFVFSPSWLSTAHRLEPWTPPNRSGVFSSSLVFTFVPPLPFPVCTFPPSFPPPLFSLSSSLSFPSFLLFTVSHFFHSLVIFYPQEALLNYYRKVVLMSQTKPFQPIVVRSKSLQFDE